MPKYSSTQAVPLKSREAAQQNRVLSPAFLNKFIKCSLFRKEMYYNVKEKGYSRESSRANNDTIPQSPKGDSSLPQREAENLSYRNHEVIL